MSNFKKVFNGLADPCAANKANGAQGLPARLEPPSQRPERVFSRRKADQAAERDHGEPQQQR
jgi:hypothetical protein